MTVITTSTESTATAYGNQRKVDRCSNGVLWAFVHKSGNDMVPAYSIDNGLTWTVTATGSWVYIGSTANARNFSVFIDQDDYAHIVYRDGTDGYVRYRRGTPNVDRTAWTWSAAELIGGSASYDYPDIVAHREGTGWVAHIVGSQVASSTDTRTRYARVVISNTGTLTVSDFTAFSNIGGVYANNRYTYPSIDFNHTGDGKTVKDGTPHLYAAWSAGSTGTGAGIRFRKATYSGGSWTWGTEREIDSTRYVPDSSSRWMNCLFDGTRVVIVGQLVESDGYNDLMVYDRDVADTTTTMRVLVNGSAGNNVNYTNSGSASYDASGNIYFFGRTEAGANGTRTLVHRRWTRGTAILESPSTIDATASDNPYVSVKRGYSNNRIEFIYTDGTASPYSVTYDSILLNQPPTVTVTAEDIAKIDPRVDNTISWSYSDPESDPQTSFDVVVKEPAIDPVSWSTANASKTGTIHTYTVPADGVYTIEAIGAVGGQSSDSNAGGKGARSVGDFVLTAGTELKIISGQPGQKPTETSRGGGGGGASWVYVGGAAEPMLVAGGGGGGGNYAYSAATQDASITTAGKAGTVGTFGAGGTNGNGGGAGNYAAGGAGWKTNGTNGYSPVTGGQTPANGALGGNPYSSANAEGGFGGGGGAYAGAGGGAGYSGGGAGGWSNSGLGGGGGSYNAGTNQIMEAGIGTAEGSVTISQNSEVLFSTSGTNETSFVLPGGILADQETYTLVLTVNNTYHEVTVEEALNTDSWIVEAPVTTATEGGNFDLNNISRGDAVEIQVATSDAQDFGPYSSSVIFVNNKIPVLEVNDLNVFTQTEGVVKWTYTDADGDPQTAYQIRVRKKI